MGDSVEERVQKQEMNDGRGAADLVDKLHASQEGRAHFISAPIPYDLLPLLTDMLSL